MPFPTGEQMRDPAFMEALRQCIDWKLMTTPPMFADLMRRPKFRKMREVHAARARKLRRRGEHVHFLRWEHGHCIYGWGGPAPESFVFNRMPRKKTEPEYVHLDYRIEWRVDV